MKIAIASDWFAPRRGGIEAQLLRLAEGLAARGNDVDVITSTPGADGEHERGFRVRRLEGWTLPRLQLAASPIVFASLRRELGRRYDVVHAHVSVVSPVGYAAAAIARAMGLPTVVTFHSILRHKRHVLRAVNALVSLKDTAVVWTAVSELVAEQVRRALGRAEVGTLPNGIDSAFWAAARTGASKGSRRSVTLVSAMRLQRKKRPRQLLASFAHAAARMVVPSRLVVVGDGPERRAIERDIRDLGLDHGHATAEMLGWLSPESLRSVYAEADGFVTASTRESFGIAALEAVAAGLPVIAMKDTGSSEFLLDGDNALLCDNDDHLVQSLARFIDDVQLRARLASHTVSMGRYEWSNVLREHEVAYRRATMRSAALGGVAGAVVA
ncbi:MAG: glycosyltransferase [Gemmatimonadaceae bacterium]